MIATRTRQAATALLVVFVFTIPWEDLVVVPGLGTASRGAGILAGAGGVLAVAVGERRHRWVDAHLLMVAFAGWVTLSLWWSVRPADTLVFVTTMAQLLVMVLLIWEFGREPGAQRRLLWAFLAGCAVSAVGTLLAFGETAAEQTRFAVPGVNENDLAMVLALGVVVAWYLGLKASRPLGVLAARAFIPVGVLAIVLTGTRGALLVLVVAAALIPLTLGRLSVRSRAVSLGALAVTFVVVALTVPAATLARFSTIPAELQTGDLSARRQLWGGAYAVFADNPLIGVGAGVSSIGIERVTGYLERAHHTFLSVAADLGIVGLTLFGLVLLSLALSCVRLQGTERVFAAVLLASLTVGMMSLHLEYRKMTWLVFALVLSLLPLPRRDGARTVPSQGAGTAGGNRFRGGQRAVGRRVTAGTTRTV